MDIPDIPAHAPAVQGSNSLLAGRYRLHDVVGRGAMASVYRAVDETLGREVAVKLFLPGSGDDEFRMRQETEMRLLAGFDHAGLVSLYDAGTDTREPDAPRGFLVMEFVPGTNLRTRLDEGPLTAMESARIGKRLADALAQVHSNGVIHRDIKPANILIPETGGVAKLADFGVARILDVAHLTATGMTVGTASYLSPEQARGRELTTASDIYSLGLVLIECLSGRPEYPGTAMESAAARLHRAPNVPASLSPAYAGLLSSMTDLEPARRPGAEEVAGSLGALLEDLDAAVTAPTRTTIPEQPDRVPAAWDSVLHTAVLPATVPATRRRKGRHRKKTFAAGKFAAVVAVAAAAIIAPLVTPGIHGGSQQPVSTMTTTPTGIGSPSAIPTTSPAAPTASIAPPPTTAVAQPTAVVPAPALTTPPPVTDPGGQAGAGNGNGKDRPKNR